MTENVVDKYNSGFMGDFTLIPVDRIEIPECVRVFSYPDSDPDLDLSVKDHGIINPVTVAEKDPGFELVCGNKRLSAARNIKLDIIPAVVIQKDRFTSKQLFERAYSDNISFRRFNLVEAGGIVSVLMKEFNLSPGEILSKFYSVVDFRSGREGLETLKRIYRLEDSIKTFIVKWNMTVSAFSRMLDLDKEDRNKVFEKIEYLQIHGGKLRQFLELIFEICQREGVRAEALLSEKEFRAIIENPKITASQKQAKLIEYLTKRRYPELTGRAAEFIRISSEMDGFKTGTFSPPLNFEGDRLLAKIAFKSIEELEAFNKAVKLESNRVKIRSLLDML
ncbi:MAG: ParB N-terminal domain-containing protein [bacterium]|nr:ParB N-terminal domain-containing protein [bacterium]